MFLNICGVLRDLQPFVQFKKREKHPWRTVTFQTCNFTKINPPPWMFFTFFKLYRWYQIAQNITYDLRVSFRKIKNHLKSFSEQFFNFKGHK